MKNKVQQLYPVALSCAGSDSGGGAGIQADLRTFGAFGVFGCTAITAVTSQNPDAVRRIDPIPAEGVRTQLEAVFDAFAVNAMKTGMLFDSEIVKVVADTVRKYNIPLVVDPVMVATSGSVLLQSDAVAAVKEHLLPLASWITPNLPEAELLLGRKLRNPADYADAARECASCYHCGCILKTGHATEKGKFITDFVALDDGSLYALSSPRAREQGASHGTGCTLSSALAATLALDFPWKRAVCEAKAFVFGSLTEVVEVGAGRHAMYPPEEDYTPYVKLEPVKQK